jgi:putative CocE/NonD family hydrolase
MKSSTSKEFPLHLATIAPGMAAAPGVDFPMRNNLSYPYVMQWLTLTAGHASQDRIFEDQAFWRRKFRQAFESGIPFKDLDQLVGYSSAIFREWNSHPAQDEYWDAFLPRAEDYSQIDLPILSLTGCYDGDQPGALHYYREHMRRASAHAAAKHYLVIGPWDHAGTLSPKAEFGGLKFEPAALLDVLKLHLDWYDWTMRGGPKPEFLKKNVAYYVMGAETWRYADSLEKITARFQTYHLGSIENPHDVFGSGALALDLAKGRESDHYVYDPRNVSVAALESTLDPESRVEQRVTYAATGQHLIYHSAPFTDDIEVSGFFRLTAWLSHGLAAGAIRASRR